MLEYLRPGESVPKSGVYRVSHPKECDHLEHHVICIRKDVFPLCRSCGDRANFSLVRYAPDAATHEDFKPVSGGASTSS